MTPSTTARLGYLTIGLTLLNMLLGTSCWLIAALGPREIDVGPLLSFLGLLALGTGAGGGLATLGFGVRHARTGAPTSAQRLLADIPSEP